MPGRPVNLPLVLAAPLAWLYRAGMNIHRAIRRAAAHRLPIPVISVGNLSVGGTGKTPMVLHLARILTAAGRHPCIAMRGYAAAANGSDEAQSYRRAFTRLGLQVPVVAQADRSAGVRSLLATGAPIDSVLLDDGFQHHRLARNLDIVLVDATRSPFTDRLLPAGWLREPPTALARADAVVITHAEAVPPDRLAELQRQVTLAHGKPPIAVTRHAWTSLEVTPPGATSHDHHPVSWLAHKRTLLVCAIGNPAPFQHAAAQAIGAPPTDSIILRDHDPYEPGTIARMLAAAQNMDLVLTTDKDWSKLSRIPPERWPCAVARPRLELSFDHGEAELTALVLGATRPPPPHPATPTP